MSGFDNEVVVSRGARLEPSSAQDMQIMQNSPDDVSRINYTGSPEGAVAANPSSLSHDPVSGKVYVKQQGTTSTGWGQLEPVTDNVGMLAYFSTANGDDYLDGRWLKADGAILDQADYPLLFERIGYINGPFTNYLTTTTFTAGTINSMIFDGTKFVAGASNGSVGTSTNGINWVAGVTPIAGSIGGIVFANSIYVMAIGNQAYATADLITYQPFQLGNANSSQVVRGGSTYLASHSLRYTATSVDGVNWNTRSPQGPHLAVGNSRLVAGSTLNCAFTTATATDQWQVVNAGLTATNNLTDVLYLNNLFVACSSSTSSISTSTNGQSWTPRTTGTTTAWNTAAFGGGVYVLAGQAGGAFRATTNFVTYTASSTGAGVGVTTLAYGAGKFVSIQNSIVFTSTDGYTSWTNSGPLAGFGNGTCLRFLNGIFICAGTSGLYATSTDGLTWATSSPYGMLVMTDVIFENSLYLASFTNGSVGSSTDAVTWTTQTTQTTNSLGSLVYDGANYLLGSDNLIQTSTNFTAWTKLTNLPVAGSETLVALNFGNSLFLMGTSAGNILSSTDAITWASHATLTTAALSAVFGANGIFLASRANQIYRSTNLSTYTSLAVNATSTQTILSLGYVNNLYFAGGNQGYIKTSTDAITWDQVSTTVTNQSTMTVTSSSSTIVFGGNAGSVGYSLNVYPYDETTQFQLPTDAAANITLEYPSNFRRALYVRAA